MKTEHLERVLFGIMNAPVCTYPFPHFVVEDAFPAQAYEAILDNLPPQSAYTGLNETGMVKGYESKGETRYIFQFSKDMDKLQNDQKAFWSEVNSFIAGQRFAGHIINKFAPFIAQRFQQAGRQENISLRLDLLRDFAGYELGPHTDTRRRLLNLFFYLPGDNDHPHLGTSFYVPRSPGYASDGSSHLVFDDFINVYTVPARRNVVAGFFRTDQSFHGVEPVTEVGYARNALALSMYAD
jgi:hypothetical protein